MAPNDLAIPETSTIGMAVGLAANVSSFIKPNHWDLPKLDHSKPFMEPSDALDGALWAASDVMRGVFAKRVAELGLTPPQALILRLLVRPRPMKELAAHMLFDPSYVTALVDGLEERGLAERVTDPNDRRIKLITVTSAGQDAQRSLQDRISASLPGADALTVEERSDLARLLSKAVGHAPGIAPPIEASGEPCR